MPIYSNFLITVCWFVYLVAFFVSISDYSVTNMQQNKETAKKRVFFSFETKINLLKEVLDKQPYMTSNASEAWEKIAMALGSNFTGRSAKDHTDLLIQHHRKNDTEKLKRC